MKKLFIAFLVAFAWHSFAMADDNTTSVSDIATEQNQPAQYRRSSLCILLVTHQGTKYAENMERQFLKMKLPERYNEHNIQLRVLHTDKSLKAKDITSILQRNEVGKQLVAKWFNRDPYTGVMNMDLIHDRGGYNASLSDAERADMNVRGRAILQEEGVDLIQNTYVLVCDMQYKKRDDAGVWAMLGTSLLSAGLGELGNNAGVDVSKSTNLLNQAAVEMADLSGFSVIMDAHLLQLEWAPEDLNRLYSNYWVDETTPSVEAASHKEAFDKAANAFNLNYLGHYKSRSTKIEMSSSYGFDDVILEVTDRTVNKSIKELALMFPQFKPKTPLVHNEKGMMAYVGTKEDITNKTKFDVVEPVKKDGEIKYKEVGRLKVVPGTVWDNKNVRLDEISDLGSIDGTHLYSKGKKDYTDQPYMLVEGGESKYTGLKKFTFDVGLSFGMISLPEDKLREGLSKNVSTYTSRRNITSISGEDGFSFYFLDLGLTWNMSKAISWNILQCKMGYASFYDAGDAGVGTGVTARFLTLGKKKRASLFVQPTVGFGYVMPGRVDYSYYTTESRMVSYTESYYNYYKNKWDTRTKHRKEYYNIYGTEKGYVDGFSYLDWGVSLGVNYRKFFFSLRYGANEFLGARVGWHF